MKATGDFVPNICITGTNRGIGFALAKKYCQDYHVYALCRKSSSNLSNLANTTIVEGFDINLSSARDTAVSQIKNIDILILNAGILHRDTDSIDALEQSITEQIQTNAISPFIFTKMALSKLNANAKIIFMTSRMGSIEDNLSGGLDGYRMSKTALNAAGCNLAHQLIDEGKSVFLVHPGYIQTDMTNNSGRNTAEEAANNIATLIDKLNIEHTGQFWHAEGHQLPW